MAEVARCLHLNPVRIEDLGLSKKDLRRVKVIGCEDPGRELVNRRLRGFGSSLDTPPNRCIPNLLAILLKEV
jgi:hypothetical protein